MSLLVPCKHKGPLSREDNDTLHNKLCLFGRAVRLFDSFPRDPAYAPTQELQKTLDTTRPTGSGARNVFFAKVSSEPHSSIPTFVHWKFTVLYCGSSANEVVKVAGCGLLALYKDKKEKPRN